MEDIKFLCFKPKAAAGSPLAPIQLVIVAIESTKDVGPASGLGKKLGFKDMRNAADDVIQTVLGVTSKAEGE